MDLAMEERMEEDLLLSSTVEFDLEYEYSAPFFFDFSRPETDAELREAESWFVTGGRYLPSPYLATMLSRVDIFDNIAPEQETIAGDCEASTSTSVAARPPLLNDADMLDEKENNEMQQNGEEGDPEIHIDNTALSISDMDYGSPCSYGTNGHAKGLSFHGNSLEKFDTKEEKLSTKISTLMKPTLSQLAKQYTKVPHPIRDIKTATKPTGRTPKQVPIKHCKNVEKLCSNENQAAKRQKLEGGQLRKVHQLHDIKQNVNLLHKPPKESSKCSLCNGSELHGASYSKKCSSCVKHKDTQSNSDCANLRVTVPREPVLETTQRAHRIRIKNNTSTESAKPAMFKARSLNRQVTDVPLLSTSKSVSKILPTNVPKLPVLQDSNLERRRPERKLQHPTASAYAPAHTKSDNASHAVNALPNPGSSTHTEAVVSRIEKSRFKNTISNDKNEPTDSFKAREFNKKTLLSKGELGVYRNCKREATQPIGFSFATDKRFGQTKPPIEMFNKLSLKSEAPKCDRPPPMMPCHGHLPLKHGKGSKENLMHELPRQQVLHNQNGLPAGAVSTQNHAADRERLPLMEVMMAYEILRDGRTENRTLLTPQQPILTG